MCNSRGSVTPVFIILPKRSVCQPGFRRTSSQVPREIVEYIKILKYSEKFQIYLEISRVFYPAIGSTGVMDVDYQLFLFVVWPINVFTGEGSSGYEQIFSRVLHGKNIMKHHHRS